MMRQRTVPYSPQQNCVSERVHRTIMENARSMLHEKDVSFLSIEWSAEAVSTLVYLINRSTNSANSVVKQFESDLKGKQEFSICVYMARKGMLTLMTPRRRNSNQRDSCVCFSGTQRTQRVSGCMI